jgi:phosphate:Na+ symporter
VGILQALAVTGQVSYGAAIPIIMGQNIGTCVTAILSAVGANKNAKRAALVHLSFNVIGTAVWLTVFCLVKAVLHPVLLDEAAGLLGIAVAHSVFNGLCTILMLPLSGLLEKLVQVLVPDDHVPEQTTELDDRLLSTPPIALEQCRRLAQDMAQTSVSALSDAITALEDYSPALAERVRRWEEKTDHYEDMLGTYLVKLSARKISAQDSAEAAKLLKMIGDFERISDHGVNILESAEELRDKGLAFTPQAKKELSVLTGAVEEILVLALEAFSSNDLASAYQVEPLEQVIDGIKEQLRTQHIHRLQQGQCSMEAGFIWSDLLTDLERTADHCSNIAGCVIDMTQNNMNLHQSLRAFRNDSNAYAQAFQAYAEKYALAEA